LAACGGSAQQAAQPVAAPATGIVLLSLQDGSQKGSAKIGTDTVAVTVSDDGRVAYLADSSPGDVYAADLPSLEVKWRSHVGDAPFGLLMFGGHLLVSLFNTNAVVELDPSSGRQLARHTVPLGPAVMTLDAMGAPLVAGTRGNVARLDGSTVPAGHGFGVAVVGADTWTADYERAELVRAGDGHIVGMPQPLFPFWLAPGKDGTLLIAAEGGTEDTDPGGVFSFNPASGMFTTLAQPRDPDQVLQSGDSVFVAAHGDHAVLDITAGRTSVWASGTSPVAIAADPKLGMLVEAVNAHE
jgi:outer membrane protein assembly factor BamB